MEEPPRTNRTGLAAGILAAVVLVAVLAIALDLGPFADDELSSAEFLSQGDEICAQAHDEFLEIQASTPRTADDAASQVEALIEVAEEEGAGLSDLDPPASLDESVADYLADRDKGIEILRDGLEAARADDAEAYEEAQAGLASEQKRRQNTAQKLGFNQCSKPLVEDSELERQAQPPSAG
ncbi:MAG: hypothetical protein M3355_06785 [Actinomycetota bacterium]|nr:hypothetical protein [Actinomycetota bacterium]